MSGVMEIAMKDMGYLIEAAQANMKYLPGPVANVMGFGAKGDGINDDTNAIQAAINSLQGGTGTVYFPYGTYKITSSLLVKNTVELQGAMASRYGRAGMDIPSSIIVWGGLTNNSMVVFNNNGSKVYGARISSLSVDGNGVSGVIGIDLTLSSYTKVVGCNLTRLAVGVRLSGNAYYNDILFNTFEYFTDSGVKFDYVSQFTNDNTIMGNSFSFSNINTKGVYVREANSIRILLNHFEGSPAGTNFVIIEGSGCRDNVIYMNRMESVRQLDLGEVSNYAIWIKAATDQSRPSNTRISGNQIYSQEIVGGTTYINGVYDLLDEGYGTIFDQKNNVNYIPNGACMNVNNIVPMWKSDNAALTITADSTNGRMKVTCTNSPVKYPVCYQIIDAKQYRGKTLTVSAKLKGDNITTAPKIEVMCYKGGDGTLANKGTFLVGNTLSRLYKANYEHLLFSTVTVPSDADHFFININVNGNDSALPANNILYVDYICLSDRRAVILDKSQDIVYRMLDQTYVTSSRPNGSIGLHVFDTTLNKPIWFDGTSWQQGSRYVSVPASATATGTAGDWAADASYLYICYTTNAWRRVAIAAW